LGCSQSPLQHLPLQLSQGVYTSRHLP
jgi:hypothetical protein